MIQLQNNFTTIEQSRRLLELGLPADSADCKFINCGKNENGTELGYFRTPQISLYDSNFTEDYNYSHKDFKPFPCWSVGRLIEIYVITRGIDFAEIKFSKDINYIEFVIARIEERRNDMDFSKLMDNLYVYCKYKNEPDIKD